VAWPSAWARKDLPTPTGPILIASEIIVALQTIVSREMDPQLPTVVTVGSFHAGTKHNIIPMKRICGSRFEP
jgi:hypothetical protein